MPKESDLLLRLRKSIRLTGLNADLATLDPLQQSMVVTNRLAQTTLRYLTDEVDALAGQRLSEELRTLSSPEEYELLFDESGYTFYHVVQFLYEFAKTYAETPDREYFCAGMGRGGGGLEVAPHTEFISLIHLLISALPDSNNEQHLVGLIQELGPTFLGRIFTSGLLKIDLLPQGNRRLEVTLCYAQREQLTDGLRELGHGEDAGAFFMNSALHIQGLLQLAWMTFSRDETSVTMENLIEDREQGLLDDISDSCSCGWPVNWTADVELDRTTDGETIFTLARVVVEALQRKDLEYYLQRIKTLEVQVQALEEGSRFHELIGGSKQMRLVYQTIQQVAPTGLTVLIRGETGTGKELVARAVHQCSGQSDGPFVPVNCAAFPESLLESELFGHERGAFTGADREKPGRFEMASGGTLFLDEIGDVSSATQVKLLRLLEDQTFERVGGTKSITTDARIVAATNRNLEEMIASKEFREDLYFRLNVLPINIPPLRTRREDVALLAQHFLESSDGALWMAGRGREPIRFDASTQRWMTCNNLNFACEDAEGGKWFLEVSGKVVRMLNDVWTSYGRSDGLMDTPTGLITASNGDVWAVGSHDHQAASAQLTNGSWQLKTYPELSWGVDGRAVLAAKGGDVWLGAAVDWDASQGRQGGILRVDGNTVDHYRPLEVEVLRYVYGIGQTADGLIWIGSRRGLHHFDGQAWERVYEPEVLTSRIDVVHSSDTGDLWLGHRSRGVFHRTPAGWDQTDAEHGLADNTVRAILKTRDQSVWAVSDRGTSRFDGQTWTTPALPPELRLGPRGSLRETSDGTLWINTASETWHRRAWPLARPDRARPAIFKTVRHRPDPNTPETTIAFAQAEVSQPGNTTISWTGADPWGETQNVDLQFAWKLDDRPWSPYSSETNQIFQELGSGRHRFEVRARDQNFNVDLTPASVVFLVTPPVWQQAWFIALVVLFSIGVTLQTVRVVGRERALHRSNEALQESNSELARSNRELERSAARSSKQIEAISRGAMRRLVSHPWPGNIRDLQNVIERAVIVYASGRTLTEAQSSKHSVCSLEGAHLAMTP